MPNAKLTQAQKRILQQLASGAILRVDVGGWNERRKKFDRCKFSLSGGAIQERTFITMHSRGYLDYAGFEERVNFYKLRQAAPAATSSTRTT